MSLLLLRVFTLLLLSHIIVLIPLLLIFLTSFDVTTPVAGVHAVSPFLIFLKSFGGNTPVLSVQATTPAARNSFESPVPNFLASFALLLLLHQLALIQYL